MSASPFPLSTASTLRMHNPPEVTGSSRADGQAVLAERWPTLSRALSRYEQNTAESFSREAYVLVVQGVIRLDDRRRLATLADSLGIRPFDAQLLIACAIRQWHLDRRYDASPDPDAPALSFEYRSWSRAWLRVALLLATAVVLDAVIIYKWLS